MIQMIKGDLQVFDRERKNLEFLTETIDSSGDSDAKENEYVNTEQLHVSQKFRHIETSCFA